MGGDILEAMREAVLIGDGAIGTRLRARVEGPCTALNLSRPEIVRGMHEEYLAAGARALKTNTFLAHGLPEINAAGARIAREAAGGEAFVLGSIGPIDAPSIPSEERARRLGEQAAVLAEAGVDAVLLETFTDADELRRTVAAVRARTSVPIVAMMASETGPPPADLGADVAGLNCSEPANVLEAARKGGVGAAFPHSGLPRDVGVEEFARVGAALARAGVRLIGGCCGTGPEHVRALRRVIA